MGVRLGSGYDGRLPAEAFAGLRCLSPKQLVILHAAALRILDGAGAGALRIQRHRQPVVLL